LGSLIINRKLILSTPRCITKLLKLSQQKSLCTVSVKKYWNKVFPFVCVAKNYENWTTVVLIFDIQIDTIYHYQYQIRLRIELPYLQAL
jgi:hypothetical protein